MDRSSDCVRVLHVDDDADVLSTASGSLEREDDGFDVRTVEHPETALAELDESVDCVVSDYRLPGTDGFEFFEAVRDEYPDVPFILFTGEGSEEIAGEAVSRGVTDYLRKGTEREQYALLANRIRNAVERASAQRELHRTRERFRKLLADSADYIIVLDRNGVIEYVTPSIERVLGYDPESLIGGNALELIHPADREQAADTLESVVAEPGAETVVEVRARRDDGSWRWLEVKSRNLLDDPTIGGVVCNVRDVTERRARERAVDWHQTIIQSMEEGVYVVDAESTLRFVNYRVVDLADFSEREWVGRPLSVLADVGVISEEEVAAIEAGVDSILAGETAEVRMELEPAVPEDSEVVELRLTPVTSNDEQYVLGTTRDVTERKERQRELERKNEQLDEFTSVVSHDLRNPLTVLRGSLESAERTGDAEAFERCYRAVDRMERLVSDLRALARQGERVTDLQPVDLSRLANACWKTVETSGAELRAETDLTVRGDETRLEQLLENLFRNAAKHGPPDATSDGGTDAEEVVVTVGDCEDGFYVADDGTGVPPGERDRVFESGYSTTRRGTGFGLTIVDRVATAHGWDVDLVESAAGGARFEITGVDTVE